MKADVFREVMSHFATGVTLVTGADEDDRPVGFTANAVASVSLDPLLVLFCADRASKSLPILLRTGRFAMSMLGVEDGGLARRFANEVLAERFQATEVDTSSGGLPLPTGALAWVECRVWKAHDAGDHVIVIGEVLHGGAASEGEPLVFFRGTFGTFRDLPPRR